MILGTSGPLSRTCWMPSGRSSELRKPSLSDLRRVAMVQPNQKTPLPHESKCKTTVYLARAAPPAERRPRWGCGLLRVCQELHGETGGNLCWRTAAGKCVPPASGIRASITGWSRKLQQAGSIRLGRTTGYGKRHRQVVRVQCSLSQDPRVTRYHPAPRMRNTFKCRNGL